LTARRQSVNPSGNRYSADECASDSGRGRPGKSDRRDGAGSGRVLRRLRQAPDGAADGRSRAPARSPATLPHPAPVRPATVRPAATARLAATARRPGARARRPATAHRRTMIHPATAPPAAGCPRIPDSDRGKVPVAWRQDRARFQAASYAARRRVPATGSLVPSPWPTAASPTASRPHPPGPSLAPGPRTPGRHLARGPPRADGRGRAGHPPRMDGQRRVAALFQEAGTRPTAGPRPAASPLPAASLAAGPGRRPGAAGRRQPASGLRAGKNLAPSRPRTRPGVVGSFSRA